MELKLIITCDNDNCFNNKLKNENVLNNFDGVNKITMLKKILLISAVVVFGLAAFGVTFSQISLVPFGLALYAARLLAD